MKEDYFHYSWASLGVKKKPFLLIGFKDKEICSKPNPLPFLLETLNIYIYIYIGKRKKEKGIYSL